MSKTKKKLTVADLKRKMEVGTALTMVNFHGQEVNKQRFVAGVHASYVKLTGDGIRKGEFSYLKWPKASELSETTDGFRITYKFGIMEYRWGVKEDELQTRERTEIEIPFALG